MDLTKLEAHQVEIIYHALNSEWSRMEDLNSSLKRAYKPVSEPTKRLAKVVDDRLQCGFSQLQEEMRLYEDLMNEIEIKGLRKQTTD